MAPTASKKILLLTNLDRGEANSFLATSQALLTLDPTLDLHVASLKELEEDIKAVWKDTQQTSPAIKPITFHNINGLSVVEGVRQYHAREKTPCRRDGCAESFLRKPGLINTRRAIRDTIPIFVPFSGPQMVQLVQSIIAVIESVNSDLVVVDSLMSAGLTACFHLGIRFACLSPNAIKEFAASDQPGAAGLWKFPALFSGFPCPVPWHKIPLNIYYILHMANTWRKDTHRKEVAKYLKRETGATLRTPVDLLHNRPAQTKILVSTLPELDFPLRIPDHVIPCGPILRDAPRVSDSDPELEAWLAQGSTIYLNLGSICQVTGNQASELALALKNVLMALEGKAEGSRFQVLWKLKRLQGEDRAETDRRIESILGDQIKDGLVRIVEWIQVEPVAIFFSGHVACSIHHGGANSYNEAVRAGVPQVILPQWTDCYDYAQRVELLGIGRLGNRKAKPQWSAQELSKELLSVLVGAHSVSIRQRTAEFAKLCDKNGSGAFVAARTILQECYRTEN